MANSFWNCVVLSPDDCGCMSRSAVHPGLMNTDGVLNNGCSIFILLESCGNYVCMRISRSQKYINLMYLTK